MICTLQILGYSLGHYSDVIKMMRWPLNSIKKCRAIIYLQKFIEMFVGLIISRIGREGMRRRVYSDIKMYVCIFFLHKSILHRIYYYFLQV